MHLAVVIEQLAMTPSMQQHPYVCLHCYTQGAAQCGLRNSHSVFIGMGLQFALRGVQFGSQTLPVWAGREN